MLFVFYSMFSNEKKLKSQLCCTRIRTCSCMIGDKLTFPPNQAASVALMEDERITRALNLPGEDADLFSADREGLLILISKYFDNHATEGKIQIQPSLLSHQAISSVRHPEMNIEYIFTSGNMHEHDAKQ